MGKSKRRLKKRLNKGRQRKEGGGQAQGINHHHLTPRSRHGKSTPRNLLRIDILKHRCWHTIFGNQTLEETIAELQRLKRMKGR